MRSAHPRTAHAAGTSVLATEPTLAPRGSSSPTQRSSANPVGPTDKGGQARTGKAHARRSGQVSPAADQITPFRPAILVIRGGTTALSVALSSTAFAHRGWWIVGWCLLIVVYNVFSILQPLRYVDDTNSLIRVLFEVALHVTAVVATGYWRSPFVFSLLTAVIVAGFARGFGFALRIGTASALAVSIPSLAQPGTTVTDFRVASQWTIELLLVALVAGYARRVTGDVDRQHSLALDRLGRLTEANTLLFSLHRVAQSLPASLDLDDVLDSTISRMRDLFDYHGVALLLFDDTDGTWQVARSEGPRLPPRFRTDDLPAALQRAIELRTIVEDHDLSRTGNAGFTAAMSSGLYAVLPTRQSVVGLLAVEHEDTRHFSDRDTELLSGFAEPAALAIDNAQWFARLRTVGADEERTRIARDLHDRIGQSLAYVAFELDRIVKADGRGEAVSEKLDRLRSDVRGVISEVRDTLYDLRTDVSEAQDMAATLGEFLDRVAKRSGLQVRVRAQATGRLPLLQEREMWRIAQEAVINVERHARARQVSATWRCDGAGALLEVVDDGVGLPDETSGRLDSYGVMGMRERAASIGASLELRSEPGRGTTLRCELRSD